MVKFYGTNNELDIDDDLNKFLDDEVSKSGDATIKSSWTGNTQNESIIDTIVDRLNFFIKTGSITYLDKQGISEITFDSGFCNIKSFNKSGTIISEKNLTPKWDFGRYHILRYHLFQDLKEKLKNLDILDLDSLAIEYNIDKGFLIDFIYSFINKNFLEISVEDRKSLLKIKSNLDQILNKLDESINEMEINLTAESVDIV